MADKSNTLQALIEVFPKLGMKTPAKGDELMASLRQLAAMLDKLHPGKASEFVKDEKNHKVLGVALVGKIAQQRGAEVNNKFIELLLTPKEQLDKDPLAQKNQKDALKSLLLELDKNGLRPLDPKKTIGEEVDNILEKPEQERKLEMSELLLLQLNSQLPKPQMSQQQEADADKTNRALFGHDTTGRSSQAGSGLASAGDSAGIVLQEDDDLDSAVEEAADLVAGGASIKKRDIENKADDLESDQEDLEDVNKKEAETKKVDQQKELNPDHPGDYKSPSPFSGMHKHTPKH